MMTGITAALDAFVTLTGPMRVHIVRPINAAAFEPFDVSHFETGKTYTVGPKLGALLIVSGYAEPEMGAVDLAADAGYKLDRER